MDASDRDIRKRVIGDGNPLVGPGLRVRGKFFYRGSEKLTVCGVTYGTFRPDEYGSCYPAPDVVDADFAQMVACGVNVVRVYTVPPRWLLDAALDHGLLVMVGLPWEQHVSFLDERWRRERIVDTVRAGVRRCAGHPAVFAFAIGNEIPAPMVRWYGRRRVERFIERLYRAAKKEDPEALVTYVNYPTTEYLQLPFLDFVCFNVYLETQPKLEAYLARLQNLAGDRPLMMAEVGLDSRRDGEATQAVTLGWQLRSVFASGCAGAFVFAWTDEWHRGGHDIDDWDFGLVDRERRPKEALEVVRKAFAARAGHGRATDWPRISVVVCTYNGERWLRGCLNAVAGLEYPDYETIVVNDGSVDDSGRIAEEYDDVRVIHTENEGLSAARNAGLRAATGAIVAYLDDDARPDPEWLTQLALAFERSSHAAIGGPNLPPPDDGFVADCVASAPGGPIHVLLDDHVAEHVPGCNMAVRRANLVAAGGFDPLFRIAGDDVDVCWRLQDRGETIGFSYGAVVWHHRRDSVRSYLRQQVQYGKAEAMLEKKWPGRFNRAGHVRWAGRVYGSLPRMGTKRRAKVHYGTWGTGLFQSVYAPAPGTLASLPLMPEWYLALAALAVLSPLALLWTPLVVLPIAFVLAAGAAIRRALIESARVTAFSGDRSVPRRVAMRGLTAALHMLQPLVRLAGRVRNGLTPWRRQAPGSAKTLPVRQEIVIWSEEWTSAEQRLAALEADIGTRCRSIGRGADYDRWDLEVRVGPLGAARLLATVEEHGGAKQLVRYRLWPRPSRGALAITALLAALAVGAALSGAAVAGAILAAVALVSALYVTWDCAGAITAASQAIRAATVRAHPGSDILVDVRRGSGPPEAEALPAFSESEVGSGSR